MDVEITEKKFFKMLEIYNWIHRPDNKAFRRDGFKSKHSIAQHIEGINPSMFVRYVISDMLSLGLFVFTPNDRYVLDDNIFEKFVEEHYFGRVMFQYADNVSTIRY